MAQGDSSSMSNRDRTRDPHGVLTPEGSTAHLHSAARTLESILAARYPDRAWVVTVDADAERPS
jgi:hypothetical protein